MKKHHGVYTLASLMLVCASCSDSGTEVIEDCNCFDTQTCIDNVCIDNTELCAGIKCGETEVCINESCVESSLLCGETLCTSEQTCIESVCVENSTLCGDKVCTSEQTCINDACVDNSSLCGQTVCHSEQTCIDNLCVDNNTLCGSKVCTSEETCVESTCVETSLLCGQSLCSEEQTCINEVCVENSMLCGESVCTSTQTCLNDTCVENSIICGITVCTEEETCVESTCIKSSLICGTEICTETQICMNGKCINPEQMCGEAVCSQEQSCYQNECIATELLCGGIICGELQTCVDGVCKDPLSAQLLVDVEGAPVVSEDGTTFNVQVKLATQPKDDVVVSVRAFNSREVSVSPVTLTFTAENWNTAQIAVVRGEDDYLVDGAVASVVAFASGSKDSDYHGLEKQIAVTTEDNDVAGMKVESVGASLTEAGEDRAEVKVVLTAQPKKDVTIAFVSSDSSELVVDGESSIVFTAVNWNVPQTVKLKAADDFLADGTQTAMMTLKSTSEDALFNLMEAETASYTIVDNETVGLVITPSSLSLTPSADKINVAISLTSEPYADVVVTLSTTNETTAALSGTTYTFTPENWNTPQNAEVTCTDFMAPAKAVTTERISAIATGDEGYDQLKSNDIDLKIYAINKEFDIARDPENNNVCNMDYVTLLPGTYKLEAWGAQGGSDGPGGGRPGQAGGKGGYAAGTITLTEKTTIYYMIGEYSPSFNTHGVYNPCGGGGTSSGSSTGAGGGGATHFASASRGALANYDEHREEIYLVAGGGGGAADYAAGGAGGGETGGNGMGTKFGAGATQTTGYKFGMGEPASGQNPGGGSGWYGGRRSTGGVQAGGGGGSGYIGGVQNGVMESGVQVGNGKAKITIIEDGEVEDSAGEGEIETPEEQQ